MRTRIKICGITCVEDARAAAGLGADAIGLVFHERSPRRVDIERAATIAAALPLFCAAVGAVRRCGAGNGAGGAGTGAGRSAAVSRRGNAGILQRWRTLYQGGAHARRRRPAEVAARYEGAAALLLDAWHAELPGGTGTRFDWQALPAGLTVPVMLAGGLDADNVAAGMRIVRPYGVDVSSGVEAAPGTKDAGRMRAFVRAVMRADNDAS